MKDDFLKTRSARPTIPRFHYSNIPITVIAEGVDHLFPCDGIREGNQKRRTPLNTKRGLPLDRKPHYRFLLLEAFSGLILALADPEASLT
jgi:hypothetical protein